MDKLIADASLPEKLRELRDAVEVCDPNGQMLGYFMPKAIPLKEWLTSDLSNEELSARVRRAKLEGGRSLTDILADLEKRA